MLKNNTFFELLEKACGDSVLLKAGFGLSSAFLLRMDRLIKLLSLKNMLDR